MLLVLAGNKCDLPDREVLQKDALAYASEQSLQYFETSAKANINVDEMFEYIGELSLPYLLFLFDCFLEQEKQQAVHGDSHLYDGMEWNGLSQAPSFPEWLLTRGILLSRLVVVVLPLLVIPNVVAEHKQAGSPLSFLGLCFLCYGCWKKKKETAPPSHVFFFQLCTYYYTSNCFWFLLLSSIRQTNHLPISYLFAGSLIVTQQQQRV